MWYGGVVEQGALERSVEGSSETSGGGVANCRGCGTTGTTGTKSDPRMRACVCARMRVRARNRMGRD